MRDARLLAPDILSTPRLSVLNGLGNVYAMPLAEALAGTR
jgi:hypothetical protein